MENLHREFVAFAESYADDAETRIDPEVAFSSDAAGCNHVYQKASNGLASGIREGSWKFGASRVRAGKGMKPDANLAPGRLSVRSTLLLWLVFIAFAGAAALLTMALQRADDALWPRRESHLTTAPPTVRVAFAPTFGEAAEALRRGRHAEAYGRFVALADDGDVDAGRIALLMHRFGPAVFGSTWDASTDQLALWTRWSSVAAERDLAQLRPTAPLKRHITTDR